MHTKLKKIKSKIRLRTWIALGMIVVLAPLAFLLVFSAEATPNPPAAYWNLDEGVDNTCSGGTNDVCDSVGSYDGANSGATWQAENMCVSDKCLLFDGSNDVVSIGSTVSSIRSISFWVKVMSVSTTEQLIDLNGTDYVTSVSGTITVTGFGTETIYVDGQTGTSITANNWHHVEITTTSDFSGSAIKIGQISTNYGNFFIDNIKLYTYERASNEVEVDSIRGGDVKGSSAVFGASDTSFLNQGLVGYWSTEEQTGTTTTDNSGNSQTGTLVGSPTWAIGKYGSAVSFSNNEVQTTADTLFDFTSDFSLSFWINVDSTNSTSYRGVMGKWSGTDGSGWDLGIQSGKIRMTLRGSSKIDHGAGVGNSLGSETWHHVVIVNTPTKISTYEDGMLVHTKEGTWTSVTNDQPFWFGDRGASSTGFIGELDEVRVYNRAVTAAQVSNLYAWAPGPTGYWPMDENTGQYAFDRSGNGNTGSLGDDATVEVDDPGWGIGKFGGATTYNGGTSDKNIEILDHDALDIDTYTSFTVMAWVKRTGGASFNNPMYVVDKSNSGAIGYELKLGALTTGGDCNDATNDGTSACFVISDGTDEYYMYTTGSAIIADSVWHHIAAVFDRNNESNNKIYIDGIAQTVTINGTLANIGTAANTNRFCIGVSNGGADCSTQNEFNGSIDELRLYNYARTPGQIIEDMNGGHPTGGSPIGTSTSYWKFDETNGTTAYDANDTSGNDLTLSTASWTTSGKYNSAWNGNGTAYLSRADDSDFDVAAADDYSVSLWFKSDATANPGSAEYLFNKANATTAGYAVYANTSGYLCFGIDDDTTWSPDVASCSSTDIYDNTWHHLVAVRNVAADLTELYVDGILVDFDTDSTTATLANSLSLYIGDRDGTDNGDEFNGDLDEIKIFRDALSADEVKLLYNANSVTNFGTGTNEADDIVDGAGNPPVGYWNYNENTGSTVKDLSGNGVDLTKYGTGAYAPGKIGSSMTFNGNETGDDTHASVQTDSFDSNTQGTLCMWVKPYDTGDSTQIITSFAEDDNGSHTDFFTVGFDTATNSLFVQIKDNNSNVLVIGTEAVTVNSWSHFCITNTTTGNALYLNGQKISPTYSVGSASTDVWIDNISENTTGFSVGCNDADISVPASCSGVTAMFEGEVDEVKLWDYARTPAQIAYDYNRGAPTHWYKMDECTGTDIYNNIKGASGAAAGINGSLTIGGSGTQTSAGTCTTSGAWYNGATGKLNSGMSLDGTDDYITVATPGLPTADFTYAAWVKINSTNDLTVFMATDGSGGNELLFKITSGSFQTHLNGAQVTATGSSSISTGTWAHIASTRSGSTVTTYLNGRAVTTGTDGTALSFSTCQLLIGADADATCVGSLGQYFDGLIDDVRIYNYSLSADQIKKVMNDGSIARFGPSEGQP
ncbi:hypothetical protein C4564_04655 [Candidatus Microgenomates bacterium]|nr:MAG: hypothetical protein C4564_04655 [Candidatus Microgenomates bacterium]